ncbi:protein kinase domain-containing protein [Pseudoxanthomonas mexicana]|uniref:protein kinase domain-containing protein n=1 Tax=Pseudoxanthomonas mexicana TaxID=128785 RepID=UPI00398A6865
MDAARWQRLSPLLDVLLELDARARAQQLSILRAEDPALADELEKLLALEDQDEDFMAEPLLERSAPAGALQAGTLVGPYRLESLLGEGGMGLVWLATRADGLYQRRVALKLLRPGLADPNLRLRFTREREILARLEHPNIARLLDAGIGALGQPYLALEYVEGVPITDYCKSRELPLEARLALFRQVCDAVSHAHANLIVHRDLKPSNILVTPAGEVRLLDFGIAKLLDDPEPAPLHPRTEVRAFTLHYAAPEQVRGEPVSTRTDVYSLGVVLYELLAHTKPYRLRRQTDAEWEEAILAVEPLKPSLALLRGGEDRKPSPDRRREARLLAGDIDNLALKALAKAPEHRYPSVEAFWRDMQRHLEGRPIHARPQSLGYQMRKFLLRHRWMLAAGSLAAAVLIAALGASLWQSRQAMLEAERAQAMQDFVIGLFDNAGLARSGDSFDMRQLLEAGERRGALELGAQPLAHAELLGVIARLRVGLGDYPQALALLQQQQALLQAQDDVPPALTLESTALHGRVLRLLGRSQQCLQVMAPLEAQASRLQMKLPQQVAEFLAQDGRCRRAAGDRQGARQHYERALVLRRQLKDPAGVAENMMDMASLSGDLGGADAAIQGFGQALAYLQKHASPRHPLVIDAERSLAGLHRNRGETGLALSAYRRAHDLATGIHGAGHPVTLGIRRQMAAIDVDLGHYRQAEREFGQLHALTVQALGADHRETAASWNSLGIIAWERGDLARALSSLETAIAIWRGPDSAQQLPGGLFNYGMVLHSAGRHDEAMAALQEARRLRVRLYGASHPLVGETDRLIGEVMVARGEVEGATAWFDRALRLTRIGYGEDHPRTSFARLSMARQAGRLGHVEQALQELDALARLPGEGSEPPKLRWSARAYAAELRCRHGQRESGRRAFEQLAAELRTALPEGGALARETGQLEAACR